MAHYCHHSGGLSYTRRSGAIPVMKVTAQEVEEAVKKSGITRLHIRDCSICSYPLEYLFAENGAVGFDAGCDCVNYRNVRLSSYQAVADHVNIQNEEWAAKIWAK